MTTEQRLNYMQDYRDLAQTVEAEQQERGVTVRDPHLAQRIAWKPKDLS